MVAREFGLLANRRAEKTVAIVFQIRVELPNSAKNVTSETQTGTDILRK